MTEKRPNNIAPRIVRDNDGSSVRCLLCRGPVETREPGLDAGPLEIWRGCCKACDLMTFIDRRPENAPIVFNPHQDGGFTVNNFYRRVVKTGD